MRIAAFNTRIDRSLELSDLVSKLSETSSFTPVLAPFQELLKSRLIPLGIGRLPAFWDQNVELLLAPDGLSGIFIRILSHANDHGSDPNIDVLTISNSELPDVESLFRNTLGAELSIGSHRIRQVAERLQRQTGKTSPHGKLLADKNLCASIRRLYNDQLRKDLKSVIAITGDKSFTKVELLQTERFSERQEDIDVILNDETITTKRYIIICQSCSKRGFPFATNEQAEREVNSLDKCDSCGKRKLIVEIIYSLKDELLQGVRQGLWLELLVSDIVQEKAQATWMGQMIEDYEIDVASAYLDKVLLIECKDTIVGQRDVQVIATVAKGIRADEVIIITTNKMHHNVEQEVRRLSQKRPFITVISDESPNGIREKLNSILDNFQNEYLDKWLDLHSDSLYELLESRLH